MKNIIFDFGKVLIHYEPKKMIADFTDSADAIEEIAPVLFDRLYWDRLDLGTIEDDELLDSVCKRLPEKYHKIAREAYRRWFARCPLIDGMEELVCELKEKGYSLFLLSNISKELAVEYHEVPHLERLFSNFDGLVFSGAVGVVKPEPAIYLHLLSKYNIKAKETIFIDDSQKNLDGGAACGINPVFFDGNVSNLRSTLKKLSIL